MTSSQRILDRIRRKGPGWVFTPADFADVGTPQTVGMNLLRLARRGRLRRLGRGFYDVPKEHPILGALLPSADAVIAAVRRRDRVRIEPDEAMAANELRLSEQVPARLVYLTDGPARIFKVGPVTFVLRHRSPRKLAGAGKISSLVIAALRALGRQQVTHERIAHLRELLRPEDRRRLLADLPQAPAWMRPFMRYIAGPEEKP